MALGQDSELGLLGTLPDIEIKWGVVSSQCRHDDWPSGIFAGGDMVPSGAHSHHRHRPR